MATAINTGILGFINGVAGAALTARDFDTVALMQQCAMLAARAPSTYVATATSATPIVDVTVGQFDAMQWDEMQIAAKTLAITANNLGA